MEMFEEVEVDAALNDVHSGGVQHEISREAVPLVDARHHELVCTIENVEEVVVNHDTATYSSSTYDGEGVEGTSGSSERDTSNDGQTSASQMETSITGEANIPLSESSLNSCMERVALDEELRSLDKSTQTENLNEEGNVEGQRVNFGGASEMALTLYVPENRVYTCGPFVPNVGHGRIAHSSTSEVGYGNSFMDAKLNEEDKPASKKDLDVFIKQLQDVVATQIASQLGSLDSRVTALETTLCSSSSMANAQETLPQQGTISSQNQSVELPDPPTATSTSTLLPEKRGRGRPRKMGMECKPVHTSTPTSEGPDVEVEMVGRCRSRSSMMPKPMTDNINDNFENERRPELPQEPLGMPMEDVFAVPSAEKVALEKDSGGAGKPLRATSSIESRLEVGGSPVPPPAPLKPSMIDTTQQSSGTGILKRGRGRPRKLLTATSGIESSLEQGEESPQPTPTPLNTPMIGTPHQSAGTGTLKKGRGRPRKLLTATSSIESSLEQGEGSPELNSVHLKTPMIDTPFPSTGTEVLKKGRGRPRKLLKATCRIESSFGEGKGCPIPDPTTPNPLEPQMIGTPHPLAGTGTFQRGRGRPRKHPHPSITSSITTDLDSSTTAQHPADPTPSHDPSDDLPVSKVGTAIKVFRPNEPLSLRQPMEYTQVQERRGRPRKTPLSGPGPNLKAVIARHKKTMRILKLRRQNGSHRDGKTFTRSHESKPFACSQCRKLFATVQARCVHVISFHEGRRWGCNFCSKRYRYPAGRRRHEKKSHSLQRLLKISSAADGGNASGSGHDGSDRKPVYQMNNDGNAGTYHCRLCSQVFDSIHDRFDHIEREHSGPANNKDKLTPGTSSGIRMDLKCPICAQKVLTSSGLLRHMRGVHPEPQKMESYPEISPANQVQLALPSPSLPGKVTHEQSQSPPPILQPQITWTTPPPEEGQLDGSGSSLPVLTTPSPPASDRLALPLTTAQYSCAVDLPHLIPQDEVPVQVASTPPLPFEALGGGTDGENCYP